MKHTTFRYKASASITTVIALTSILLLGGIVVLLNAMDVAKSTKSSLYASTTNLKAITCFEESLQKLKYEPTYTGSINVTYDGGSCQAVVTNHPTISAYKLILISATIDDYAYTENKIVDVGTSPFSIIN